MMKRPTQIKTFKDSHVFLIDFDCDRFMTGHRAACFIIFEDESSKVTHAWMSWGEVIESIKLFGQSPALMAASQMYGSCMQKETMRVH